LVVSCWLSVVGCQLLVVSCWLSVVGCQLLVVSCQGLELRAWGLAFYFRRFRVFRGSSLVFIQPSSPAPWDDGDSKLGKASPSSRGGRFQISNSVNSPRKTAKCAIERMLVLLRSLRSFADNSFCLICWLFSTVPGLLLFSFPHPAINRWAILTRPSGAKAPFTPSSVFNF